ncbi:MAG: 50S ribosomal protein L21 [Pseudomonadota bacterium]
MFAVIRTGGKQYTVAKDDLITVERLPGDAGETVALTDVLMVGDGEAITVGAPLISGATVAAEIMEQGRAKKIVVFKKKRRQNYRRKKGHRQLQTTLKVVDILTDGKTVETTAKAAPAPKTASTPKTAPTPKTSDAKADPAPAVAELEPQRFESAPEGADDLTKIAGVGPKLANLLNDLGIYKFEQIAAWTPENVAWVDERLTFKGRIERDDWISKAAALAAGDAGA